MNTKNVIKRIGVVIIFGPIFVILSLLNVAVWFSVFLWGPIYYIITGNDPMTIVYNGSIVFVFADWYMKKFGPDKDY